MGVIGKALAAIGCALVLMLGSCVGCVGLAMVLAPDIPPYVERPAVKAAYAAEIEAVWAEIRAGGDLRYHPDTFDPGPAVVAILDRDGEDRYRRAPYAAQGSSMINGVGVVVV
ncbi:MAG: hypothetical protein ACYTF0_05815, partial [Planctomycetota bacterium]